MISHLRSMLGRLQSFIPAKLRHAPWLTFFGLLLIVGFFLSLNLVSAIDLSVTGIINGLIGAVARIMLVLANLAIGMTIFFLRFFIALASYNNYIDVDVVQLGWIMIRDVANMFFVVALLVIAFGTILGLEEYEWKKNLVKLILAAILINFSNLIAQLIIDVAHVFTITFLNAISATAGGNLINMFKLGDMTALVGATDSDDINLEILGAVIPAMLFAIMAMFALGSYVFVMMFRVAALWALIILSPLAFILGVLPKTKSYADEWWKEFSNYVIVAPIMVFFLWLSFATLGLGNIAKDIQKNSPEAMLLDSSQSKMEYGPMKLSLSKVTTWENMASFLIAFVFLMEGIKRTQQTGVQGSEMVGGAKDLAKKVGSVVSGYSAARWMASGAADLGKKAVKGALWHAPLIGGEKWVNRGKAEFQSWRSWYYSKGASLQVDKLDDQAKEKQTKLNDLKQKQSAGTITNEEQAQMPQLEREIESLQKQSRGFKAKGGIIGIMARSGIALERRAGKAQKLADVNREIIWKRSSSESGGYLMGTGGILRHIGLGEESVKDQDRSNKGILEAEEMRSDSKTGQMSAEARKATLSRYRVRDGKMEDWAMEDGSPAMTMAEQIASQQERKSTSDKQADDLLSAAKQKFFAGTKGQKSLTARIKADLNIKASEAETKRMEQGGLVQVAMQDKKTANLAKEIYDRNRGAGATQEQAVQNLVEQGLVSKDMAAAMAASDKPEEFLKGVVGRTIGAENEAKASEAQFKKLEETEQSGARKEFFDQYGGRMGDIRSRLQSNDENVRNQAAAEMQDLWQEMEESKNPFARRIAAEKQAHTEGAKVTQIEKAIEEAYYGGHHGQEELEEEAEIKARQTLSESEIKRMEAQKGREFKQGIGRQIIRTTKKSELQTKGEEAVDKLVETQEETTAMLQLKGIVRKTVEAEKKTQTATTQGEKIKAFETKEFLRTDEGKDTVREQAATKIAIARDEAEAKKIEAKERKKATQMRRGDVLQTKKEELRTQAEEGEIKAIESTAAQAAAQALGAVIQRINLSDQAVKAADDFVKEIKTKDLAKQFEVAGETLNQWLKLTGDQLETKLAEAREGRHGSMVKALAAGQRVKLEEEKTGFNRRVAEDAAHDAFVYKPRYGSTSPSTAFAEYSKSQMDEFRRLERVAAMKKATDIMADLNDKQERGITLDVDQKANLAAATSFLTEEAWVDDQGEYIVKMLKQLRDGKLNGADKVDEKRKWESMARMFGKLGWIESTDTDDKTQILDTSGNLKSNVKVKEDFQRKESADLQALALTGLDVDLRVAHNAIAQIVDNAHRAIETLTENTKEELVDGLLDAGQFDTQMANMGVDDARKGEIKTALDDERNLLQQAHQDKLRKEQEAELAAVRKKAQAKAKKDGLKGGEATAYVDEQVTNKQTEFNTEEYRTEKAAAFQVEAEESLRVRLAQIAKKELDQAVSRRVEASPENEDRDYWKVADRILPTMGLHEIGNGDQLKERYEKHSDMLQFATRTFKKNGLDAGHEELGANSDYDDARDTYRFTTVEEGSSVLRADRVKIDTQKLLNTDQYHSNGALNFATNIIDDFIEKTLSTTLGKVTKMIELSRMPVRSLKGHFYVQKNEDVAVNKRIVNGKVVQAAVVGGEAAQTKFIADGDGTAVAQKNHMMARGMLTHLMSGWRGTALAASKLYQHTTEQDAQQGIVNLEIGDQFFNTTKDMAKYILHALETEDEGFMKSFNESRYRGQEQRVMRQMKKIRDERPRAEFGKQRADDENEHQNA